MLGPLVYLLCALTSALCALLLLRNYRRTRLGLLFWSSLCFAGLALNNVILFIDLVLLPQVDLAALRVVPALAGLALLLWGFVWDSA